MYCQQGKIAITIIGCVQVFLKKAATTLGSTSMVACFMHVLLWSVSTRFLLWRIEIRLKWIVFLSMSMEWYKKSGTSARVETDLQSLVYWKR